MPVTAFCFLSSGFGVAWGVAWVTPSKGLRMPCETVAETVCRKPVNTMPLSQMPHQKLPCAAFISRKATNHECGFLGPSTIRIRMQYRLPTLGTLQIYLHSPQA